jgi:hypothetical protein
LIDPPYAGVMPICVMACATVARTAG